MPVEEVGDALEQYGCLAGAGDAADQQRRYVLVADDLVLLLLDGRRDGRQAR